MKFSGEIMIYWFGIAMALLIIGSVMSNDYEDAIFVARIQNLTGPADPVKFDREEIDVRGTYDLRAAKFYALKDGIYWASMNTGALPGQRTNFIIRRDKDDSYVASAARYCKHHNGTDTRSRDIMINLKALESLRVDEAGEALLGDTGLQSSLVLFRLTDLMKNIAFFSVANTAPFDGKTNEIIKFSELLVDEGKGFDMSTGMYNVPISGYYYVSYSIGHAYKMAVDTIMRRNVAFLAGLESNSTVCNDINTLAKGSLVFLRKGDLIYINLSNTSRVYSSVTRQTSFSGFLYDPITGQRGWSVSRVTGWSGNEDLSPIPFDTVSVDIGSNWDANQHAYIPRLSGVYYISFSVGAKVHQPVDVSLMVGGQRKASLTRTATDHNGAEVMSRSALVYLSTYTRVYLMAKGGTSFYSNEERQVEFTGFRLFDFTG